MKRQAGGFGGAQPPQLAEPTRFSVLVSASIYICIYSKSLILEMKKCCFPIYIYIYMKRVIFEMKKMLFSYIYISKGLLLR